MDLQLSGLRVDVKKGEGSKGGKVIGHTSSGKPVYESHGHVAHGNYDPMDHQYAANQHKKLIRIIQKRSRGSSLTQKESEEIQFHNKQIESHMAAKKKQK